MKVIFWVGLLIECLALSWYLYQIWILSTGRSDYFEEAYPDLYRKNIIPAIILFVIISGAVLAQFWFKLPKMAVWIVLSPVILGAIALVGMMISSMFIRDWK